MDISYNIEDYTIKDLVDILELPVVDVTNIKKKTNILIKKYENNNDRKMLSFFKDIQEKLLSYFYSEKEEEENIKQEDQSSNSWYDSETLSPTSNNQKNKITNRKNEVEIFEGDNPIMKRKQLGVNQSYEIDVVQGQMNPTLRNVTTKIINIDSQFRPNNVPSFKGVKYSDIESHHLSTWSSTNFSVNLSDPLINTLSLKLNTFQVPYAWYNIEEGLNCFVLVLNNKKYIISIPPGNYKTGNDLVNEINKQINLTILMIRKFTIDVAVLDGTNEFELKNYIITVEFQLNQKNIILEELEGVTELIKKIPFFTGNLNIEIKIEDSNVTDPLNSGSVVKIIIADSDIAIPESSDLDNLQRDDTAFTELIESQIQKKLPSGFIKFIFDESNGRIKINLGENGSMNLTNDNSYIEFFNVVNNNDCGVFCNQNVKINNNFGWILGYRANKYFLNEFIEIKNINLKESDRLFELETEALLNLNGTKYLLLILEDFNSNRVNKGLVNIQDNETRLSLPNYYTPGILDNNEIKAPQCDPPNPNGQTTQTFVSVPKQTQGNPPLITKSQQYTVNEIIKNRKSTTISKVLSPSTTNVFALIPINKQPYFPGELITVDLNSLQSNVRDYFGPVDIERLKVSLLDDKGNILNLHGADWNFSMISKHLYQY